MRIVKVILWVAMALVLVPSSIATAVTGTALGLLVCCTIILIPLGIVIMAGSWALAGVVVGPLFLPWAKDLEEAKLTGEVESEIRKEQIRAELESKAS